MCMCSEMWHMIQFHWSFSINHNMTGHKRLKMAHHNLFYVKMYSFFLFFVGFFWSDWLKREQINPRVSLAAILYKGCASPAWPLQSPVQVQRLQKRKQYKQTQITFLLFYMRFVSLVWAIHKLLLYFSLKNNSNIL